MEQFFEMKKLTWKAIEKEHDDIQKKSVVAKYIELSFDKNDIRVIPEKGSIPDLIDALAKNIGQVLKRQSDKDLPRVYFSQGITCLRNSQNKMSGHKMQGVLIILLLILCSTGGAALFYTYKDPKKHTKNRGMGQTRAAQWIKLIERCLCLEELMKNTSGIPYDDMLAIKEFIDEFLHQDYLETINQKMEWDQTVLNFIC